MAEAAYYRIGWVNMETFRAVQAEGGREWLDVFAFHDVVNRGQTNQTLSDLEPGVQYAFIMASVGQRFGNAAGWSNWTYLTTAAEEVVSCPTGTGTTPGAPGGGGSGAPTPTPQPGATPAATATPTPTPTPAPAADRDYDADDDGLIEIASLAQLDVIRHDLDGDGVSVHADYAAAFPNAMEEMGCFAGCSGYELAANLDFDTNGSGRADAGDAYWNEGEGWLPIGDPETDFRFNTTFDGNGHTIANLYIRWTDTNHIGFFRATGEDAVIRNLGLTALRIAGGDDRVGGLVGDNDGAIVNSYTTGRVAGGGRVGGLVGFNSGNVSGSYSSVPVAGSGDRVGGLVGSSSGSVSDSYATGAVTGEARYVGGLVGVIGNNSDAIISNSYATSNVAGDGENVGGLVGYSGGSISNSHATGNVTGEGRDVGGLLGDSRGTISTSYATGNVTGEGGNVGGLVGDNRGTISASYATGNVTGEGGNVGGLVGDNDSGRISASYATGGVIGERGFVGGLVGDNNFGRISASYATGRVTSDGYVGGLAGGGSSNNVTDSYWDTQTTGQPRSTGGAGKTTQELQAPTAATGIYANWNAEWWDFGTSRQYPVLKYQGMDVAAQRR